MIIIIFLSTCIPGSPRGPLGPIEPGSPFCPVFPMCPIGPRGPGLPGGPYFKQKLKFITLTFFISILCITKLT